LADVVVRQPLPCSGDSHSRHGSSSAVSPGPGSAIGGASCPATRHAGGTTSAKRCQARSASKPSGSGSSSSAIAKTIRLGDAIRDGANPGVRRLGAVGDLRLVASGLARVEVRPFGDVLRRKAKDQPAIERALLRGDRRPGRGRGDDEPDKLDIEDDEVVRSEESQRLAHCWANPTRVRGLKRGV